MSKMLENLLGTRCSQFYQILSSVKKDIENSRLEGKKGYDDSRRRIIDPEFAKTIEEAITYVMDKFPKYLNNDCDLPLMRLNNSLNVAKGLAIEARDSATIEVIKVVQRIIRHGTEYFMPLYQQECPLD